MRKSYLIAAAAGLLLALGGAAQAAGGHGLGGGGGLPSGLSNPSNPNSQTGGEPKGWDQGSSNAWWKEPTSTTGTTSTTDPIPPGLSGATKH